MILKARILLFILASLFVVNASAVVIASKPFTENYILAEIVAQKIEEEIDANVSRKMGMGGTGILFEALKAGSIDVYPEYTGTIAEALLHDPSVKSIEQLTEALKTHGLVISKSLGFNNTYAIAVREDYARANKLSKISDLKTLKTPPRLGFSHEFASRADGYANLRNKYQWQGPIPQSMEHALSYEALAGNSVDVIDAYSTDAKIEKLNLVLLEDDLGIFPTYEAVLLARADYVRDEPEQWAHMLTLENRIDEKRMMALNAELDIDKRQLGEVARSFRRAEAGETGTSIGAPVSLASRIWSRTQEHLVLVGAALLFSILVGVPLGLLAIYQRHLGQAILLLSGLVQTIPSLALLCFLIPLFGIGFIPSLVALCLYGLLPIVVGTFVGIRSIDPHLIETARALGLGRRQRITQIELPLASRNIIAGIRTSAVVGIGMATLAALIGGGGYGAPILMGLATNNMQTILMGAVPATVMAVVAHMLFLLAEKYLVPKGLQ